MASAGEMRATMSLFETVPTTLFRPLASPSAAIYTQVLLALFAATKQQSQPLSLLIQLGLTDQEKLEQAQITDYRRYLSYDIDVIERDGTRSRLSKIMGQTSGGETQTPFYVTIAASFVQLYKINERSKRSTIRIVAFDEAFSKMDQDRIGSTLDLFHHFGLQIITATPIERCEYLVPKMCTTLVLTGLKDRQQRVLVEPYRNYAARLEALNAESEQN